MLSLSFFSSFPVFVYLGKKIDFQSPCSFKPHSRVREKRESRVLLQNSDERYFFLLFFCSFFCWEIQKGFLVFLWCEKEKKAEKKHTAHRSTHTRQRKNQWGKGEGNRGRRRRKHNKEKNSLSQNPVSSIVDRPKPLAAPLPPAPPAPPFPASEGSSMYCDRIERTSAAIAALMRAR